MLPEVSVAAVEERLTGPIGAFTLTRTGSTGESLDVQVRRWNSGTETSATSTVRIQRGRDSVTRRVQAGDNNLVEDDIEMRWTLLDGEDYRVSAEQGTASLVLLESDVPEFSVSAHPVALAEGESAEVRVEIANGVRFARPQTIALGVAGSAAARGRRLRALAGAADAAGVCELRAGHADGARRCGRRRPDETVTVTATHEGASIGSVTVTVRRCRVTRRSVR